MSTKTDQLEWRRSKVVGLRARGLSQTEIARELQVSKASISLDMQYLREQAKESIKEYVTEYLPEQYQVCLSALDTIIRCAFEILETSDDNRIKLQAMELFKDTHLVKLELLSNATTIYSALNYIRSNTGCYITIHDTIPSYGNSGIDFPSIFIKYLPICLYLTAL